MGPNVSEDEEWTPDIAGRDAWQSRTGWGGSCNRGEHPTDQGLWQASPMTHSVRWRGHVSYRAMDKIQVRLCQVHTPMRRDEAAAGWGGEGAEGAAVETDAEEVLVGPGTAAVKDEVVVPRFARREVRNFKESERGDGGADMR
jgi:hypothetical protein